MTEPNAAATPPPAAPAAHAPGSPASAPPPLTRRPFFWPAAAAALVLVLVVGFFLILWVADRLTTSETDDAFVEGHIVNIAPQTVSGHITRYLVEENDTVKQGDVLAEIDPTNYQDQVAIARTQLETAQAQLDRLKEEVPIQIEIARRTLASTQADYAKAKEERLLTKEEVARGIDEANAALAAAKADQTLAQIEYDRYTNLLKDDAATKQKAQQAARARDDADAQVNLADAKLALALAERRKNDVAERDVEAALIATQKAEKGVDLAQTGDAQVREAERQRDVRKAALQEAEDALKYTKILAPFPGVVVKRYRNLGDFASPGVAVLSMYNPDLLYVTANLEEDRLPGVAPGNPVRIDVDAIPGPFKGRVVWINKSTGAEFALMPRNVVSGEFTRVVQRVPVRIWIEKDDRWPQLRAGLSARVSIAHGKEETPSGPTRRPRTWPSWKLATTSFSRRIPRPNRGSRNDHRPRRPRRRAGRGCDGAPERRHWLAALAMLFVFFAPYQTLVQTVLTDDAVRKGLDIDEYDMTWQQVGYLVGVLYGLFTGLWLSARIGARYTLALGLLGFALGNLLCGAATGLESFVLGRFVDGFGKTMVMALGRSTLYKQFDRALLVAIGFYGVFAYATRNTTPLLMAELDVYLSWRWMYWAFIPAALLALALVWRYFRPDRPAKPMHLPIDWLAVTAFTAWVVAVVFAFELVSQVGRLDVERFRRDRDSLRRAARVPAGLARV